jgi:dimeric dUTPase (all-alpha-NTP-PPase superfamily)
MNINNVDNPETIPDNIWEEIFNEQYKLMVKYRDIEKMGNLLETVANNINTANGQKWIKDFAWRVTEELTEADEALNQCDDLDISVEEKEQLANHYVEELIDAVHFLAELTLIAGYDYTLVDNLKPSKEASKMFTSYEVIYSLGLMCNCLKNKAWKQTQMLTDKEKFTDYLQNAWTSMIHLFYRLELEEKDIYSFYFKKNAVNQFRIRSKY